MDIDLSQAFATIGTDMVGAFSLIVMGVVGLVLVVWDSFRNNDPAIPWIAAAALAGAMVWEIANLGTGGGAVFFDQIRTGGFASYINLVILGSGLLSVLVSIPYFERIGHAHGEIYAILLFSTLGMIALATANSLIMVFVGLETMSIALYIMAGIVRGNIGGIEAAFKYFVLGAFSTGFFLYGIALMYGATGTMYLPELAPGLAETGSNVLFWGGVGLLLVGFLFKVSAVPFHMWTPDVYQGAPTPLTGYMSTASKAAAFAALCLIMFYGVGPVVGVDWGSVLAVFAVVTMVAGNVMAIVQPNVKRMLAYSSIAHAGYLLVGITAGTAEAFEGVLFYLLVYSVMNIGAFAVIAMLEWDDVQGREQTLDSLAGVGFKRPVLGVAMGVFMFSLIGFPPLGGFIGKYAVFAPAVAAGYTWLVVIAVLASAISSYYYLRVLFVFWMKPAGETPESTAFAAKDLPIGGTAGAVVVICAVLLIILGVMPSLLNLTSDLFISNDVLTAVRP